MEAVDKQTQEIYEQLYKDITDCGLLKEYQTTFSPILEIPKRIEIMQRLLQRMVVPGELETKNLTDVLNNGIKPINWRVDQLIPERGVVFFGGTAGCFKTWLAMTAAISCATGTKYLGKFDVNKCKVLYIDEENGDITLPNRFDMIRNGMYLTNDDLKNVDISIFNNIKLDTPDSKKALNQAIDENGYKLVVIDSMVRCMEGVENDATDVRNVFNNLKDVIHQHDDVAFIILHHTIKGGRGMDSLRGSGDFAASADVVLMFNTTHKGYVNIEIAKNRHIDMSKFDKFSVVIDNARDGAIKFQYGDNEGFKDMITNCADCIEHWYTGIDNGKPILHFRSGQCKDEMTRFGYKHTTIHDAMKLLLKQGKISKHKKGFYDVCQTTLVDEN